MISPRRHPKRSSIHANFSEKDLTLPWRTRHRSVHRKSCCPERRHQLHLTRLTGKVDYTEVAPEPAFENRSKPPQYLEDKSGYRKSRPAIGGPSGPLPHNRPNRTAKKDRCIRKPSNSSSKSKGSLWTNYRRRNGARNRQHRWRVSALVRAVRLLQACRWYQETVPGRLLVS